MFTIVVWSLDVPDTNAPFEIVEDIPAAGLAAMIRTCNRAYPPSERYVLVVEDSATSWVAGLK